MSENPYEPPKVEPELRESWPYWLNLVGGLIVTYFAVGFALAAGRIMAEFYRP